MRLFLTFVAVLLVVALTAALTAPLFIDWSLHRAQVEAELSEIIGAPVVVDGPIDIRFLPVPTLILKDVKIAGEPGGPPALVCRTIELEAALASLPSGRLRFTMARLDRPTLTLARAAGGGVVFPHWRVQVAGGRVALDRLAVDGGRMNVSGDPRGPIGVDFDLDASAVSLSGPFRGSVRLTNEGAPASEIEFSGGAFENGALPLKLEAARPDGPRGVFEGVVTLHPRAVGPGIDIAYAGSATASGALPLGDAGPLVPWRASGVVSGDLDAASARDLVLRLGPEERALEARGSAKLEGGGSPRLSLTLAAKQLDLDAMLRAKGEDSAPPARALAGLTRFLKLAAASGGPPIAIDFGFSAPTAIVGAQTVSDIALKLSGLAGAPLSGQLSLNLPGGSSLQLSGNLELGSAPAFKGALTARASDIAQLRDWATQGDANLARRWAAAQNLAPYRSASANGAIEISAVGFSARDLKVTLDRSTLTGAIALTAPIAQERGRLFVDLNSDALDVGAFPDLNLAAGLLADDDLSLSLKAAQLRLGRPGDEAIDSGSLTLKMAKSGSALNLETFSLAGLGGASVEASGALGPKERKLHVRVDAQKLADFAALVARVAPDAPSRWFTARADALSPAKATLDAWSADPSVPGFDSIAAQGTAGQSQFSLSAKRSGEAADVSLTLDASDGSALMRQFGLAASGAAGQTHLQASAKGRWDLGFDIQASGALAGANLAWTGRVKPTASAEEASFFGSGTLKADNASGLLVALGVAKDNSVAAPLDLKIDMALRGDQLAIPRVTGSVAGAKIDGALKWTPAAAGAVDPDVALAQSIAGEAPTDGAQIEGELSLDHASVAAMLGSLLGAPQLKAGDSTKIIDAAFAAPPFDPPPLDLRINVGALDLGAGASARSSSARLRWSHGRLDIDDIAMTLAGAGASGRLTLRRDGPTLALTGQGAIEPAIVDRASLRGRVGGQFSFAGSGPTLAALLGGLAGEGQISLRGAAIPKLDPAALVHVLARPQAPDAPLDETNVDYALGQELDRAALPLPDGDFPAILSAGVVHVGPLKIGAGKANGAYDLRAQTLAIEAQIGAVARGKFWSGPQPVVTVSVSGGLDAPTRRIDAAPVAAGLAAQAIASETERISALEADIRERAYFNRRLKAEKFLRQREIDLANYAAEQARLKAEDDRRQAAEEAAKALQAQSAATSADLIPDPQPTTPPALRPPVSPPIPAPRPKPDLSDPTASGFY